MGGVEVSCLLDTGSMVTTITESFFRDHFQESVPKLLETGSWLTLKAANGLEIPYVGYLELDVEVMGNLIPQRGILVIKDIPDSSTQARRRNNPGLLGMNVIRACKEVLTVSPDAGENLAPPWAEAFQKVCRQEERGREFRGFARVAGRDTVRVPAGSVMTVLATGHRPVQGNHNESLNIAVEPLATALPGNLLVVPTLAASSGGQYPVRVANLGTTDVWLKPGTRVGLLQQVEVVEDDSVHFQEIV